jgi:hypothetical protein
VICDGRRCTAGCNPLTCPGAPQEKAKAIVAEAFMNCYVRPARLWAPPPACALLSHGPTMRDSHQAPLR